MRRLFTQFLLMSIFLAGFIGCLNDIEEVPLDTSDGAVTAAPTGIKIQVGDGSIHISWNAVSNAATYRLYRRWGAESGISLISDSPNTFYLDEDVINGQAYYYSIAGVNSQKLEGRRSGMIYAVPSIYNLLINGGDAYTGSRTVLLNLTAPLTTTLMRIANDSLMGGDSWELFGINREWNLDEGDGIKRVYAVFQDENGSLSPVSSNSIILDTYASIEDISFTPAPYLYSPGATVHFVLRVEDDETGGTAHIELEGLSEEIRLRDDGRGGDATAADGSYEIDFSLPASLRGIDLGVAGSFTDRAGNAAPMLEADNTISFTDPPPAVQFTGVIDSTTSGITLQWEESTEVHFLAYRIYRSDQTGVKETAEHFIRGLDNRTQTGYPDSGLKEGKTYYYKIFVVNDLEETAGSDEFAASTFDAYPDPVTMFEITSIGADRLTLTWSTSQVSDFAEYRVYRATAPGVTISSQLVVSITDREETFFDDTGIDTVGNTYYYRVMVYDLSGKYRRSNEVSTE